MASNSTPVNNFLYYIGDLLAGGIDSKIVGHGGKECVNYLDRWIRILDTSVATAIMIGVAIFAIKTYTLPHVSRSVLERKEPLGKRLLLVMLALNFGMEIGFKCASREVLYFFNPCHVITIIQIYLLASQPSVFNIGVLRLLIHYLYGACIAMLLPEIESRQLHGELFSYWLQHITIFFVVPPYLVYTWGGTKILEPMKEWAWSCFAGILFGIHHLYIMQPIAMMSEVNLNFVMCPATKDPFNGPYYRLAAVFHQALCLLTTGKIYSLLLRWLLPLSPMAGGKKVR